MLTDREFNNVEIHWVQFTICRHTGHQAGSQPTGFVMLGTDAGHSRKLLEKALLQVTGLPVGQECTGCSQPGKGGRRGREGAEYPTKEQEWRTVKPLVSPESTALPLAHIRKKKKGNFFSELASF